MTRATVAVVRCPTYDREKVREAVAEAFRLTPGADDLLGEGRQVLLKPNLLSSNDPPERAVNTHPEFVRAVVEYCIARGCIALIGDSCGSLADGSTAKAIAVTGLDAVARDTGAEIVNFDKIPAVDVGVRGGRILTTVGITRAYREADVVVTLPKFKTHGLTLLTGALKNQFGMLPGRTKKDTHIAAPKPVSMAQALVDIYSVGKPHMALMDGIVGMEGNGPAAGPPREVGLVLASLDSVALDAVVADIMGFAPGEVLTTAFAAERGLGVGDLAEIDVAGLSLDAARVEGFKTPPQRIQSLLFSLIPGVVVQWLFNQVGSTRPIIMDDRCVRCGLCVANCPVGAMQRAEGKEIICETSKCISCYCCTEVCDERAIEMKRPWAGRIIGFLVGRRS